MKTDCKRRINLPKSIIIFFAGMKLMTNDHYLLIIDPNPVNQDLKDYFNKFNIRIIQQNTLYPLAVEHHFPDAILINWSILKQNNYLINQFYQNYPVPLIIINDRKNEEVCINLLEAGADDVIISPIYPRELHARINAILRRVHRGQQKAIRAKEVLMFSKWRLYPAARQVFDDNNEELKLSAGEYDLLLTFVHQPQRVLDRETLLNVTKNTALSPLDRRIDVQISRLRQKIEIDAKKPILIKTIRNGGYMFTPRVVTLKENEIE